jgi:hypothetical protein
VLTSGIFKFGYGQWELIRNHLRQSELLRFNLVSLSRSTLDIQRRCDFLINHRFKKENAINQEALQVKPKKKGKVIDSESSSDQEVKMVGKKRKSSKKPDVEVMSQASNVSRVTRRAAKTDTAKK